MNNSKLTSASVSTSTVSQWLEHASQLLNSESARIDSECLLSFVLDKSRTWLKTWPDHLLESGQLQQLNELLRRRENGEPVAYIIGEREFWDLKLKTTPVTLIPRPDTETLVEAAIEFIECRLKKESKQLAQDEIPSLRILDLGTGTGAIALAIAKATPRATIIGVDFKEEIITLAKDNANINKVANAEFICSDWYSALEKVEPFDLIVSNPPYVTAGDCHLQQGDLRFEPHSALVAKDDGLSDIKHIIQNSLPYLKSGAGLMVEHGYEQAKKVRGIFKENGFSQIKTLTDLAGLERVTLGFSAVS